MKDYPYMYARVSAKRAKLLDESDYESFLKMQPNQIARNLEEGEYRKEINELGARHDGVELVELALNRNLANTMKELCDIAPESLENVIVAYMRRYDIQSLKRLLRWKKSGQENEIESLLTPVGSYTMEELKELAEKDFEEIAGSISFPDSEIDYQKYLEGCETCARIEKALDAAYFEEMKRLAEKVGSNRFRDFIEDEIEYENLRTALRLKKYGFTRERIEEMLVTGDRSSVVEGVLSSESVEEAVDIVRNSKWRIGEEEDLEDVEHALEVDRLRRAVQMLHTEPLGITSILGYIVAKIVEVKNLRMLIRAKETGIQNRETIRKNLVAA